MTKLPYRCIVVHSTALQARALARQQHRIAAERQSLEKALADLPTFPSAEKAREAATAWMATFHPRDHHVQLDIRPVQVRGKRNRGRPRKDAPLPQPLIRFSWTPHVTSPEPTLLQREIEMHSAFVLITNDLDRAPRALLALYKRQQTAVEISFHRTKALPVAPTFLERSDRVQAMGCVLLMAYVAFGMRWRQTERYFLRTTVVQPPHPRAKWCLSIWPRSTWTSPRKMVKPSGSSRSPPWPAKSWIY